MGDCATGILIDLDKSQESLKQGLSTNPVVSNDANETSMFEASENLILNKQLCNIDRKTDYNSPVCGILVDLDSPFNGSDLGEAAVQESVEIKVHGCNYSRSAEQIDDLTFQKGSSVKSTHILKKGNSSSSCGSSRNRGNFSWSPSLIYNDVDLLENEKFDFDLSVFSISPPRENDEVFLVEENVCKKCSCKKKPPKLSTPRKDWSLLNAAFLSEISEEASKVISDLAIKNKSPPQKSASVSTAFESSLLNSSFSVSQHSDPCLEMQGYNCNDNEILKNTSLKNNTYGCDHLVCPDEKTDYSVAQTEYVKVKSESCLGVMGSSAEVVGGIGVIEKECKNIDDCITSILSAIQIEANVSDKMDYDYTENKENIVLSPTENETSVFADYCDSTEMSNCTVNSEELILERPPSPERKRKVLGSLSEECSPLVRRETFTVKTTPLQPSNRSTPRNRAVRVSEEGSDGNLKDFKKRSFCTPKSAVGRLQQSASFSNRQLSSTSKKADAPSPHIALIRKDTYTVSPVSSKEDVSMRKSSNPSVRENFSTPNQVTKVSSIVGKGKSLSCKLMTKSRLEAPSASASSSFSKPKSPKENVASGFKTPIMPKRKSVLPSRLSYSQSCATVSSYAKAGTSVHQSSTKIVRANSFQLPKCAAVTGFASKRPPSAQGTKPRASSAGEITDSGLGKKTMPMKAIAPLGNMVKTSAVTKPSGTDGMSKGNASGNKGKTITSMSSRGLGSGRVSAVLKSEQVIRSNSLSTPKSVSTPSKPRFLSQSDTPSTPVSLKKDPGIRRLSFLPTPKRFTSN